MEVIFDRFFIRVIFTIFICLLLVLYKYAHFIIYPPGKRQFSTLFNPIQNPANTLHLFARIIGVAILFSSINLDTSLSLSISIFHLVTWGILSFVLYLVSIYLMEGIILYNFDYTDEILKRENYAYALISFSLALCLAIITKQVINESEKSIVILILLWLFSQVLFGLTTKLYQFFSKFSLNKQLVQKDLGAAASYCGFLWGTTLIISMSFDQQHYDIKSYSIRVFLKVLLSLIIMPIFYHAVRRIFSTKEKNFEKIENFQEASKHFLGHGIYEGALFLTISLLTSLIVYKIDFKGIFALY